MRWLAAWLALWAGASFLALAPAAQAPAPAPLSPDPAPPHPNAPPALEAISRQLRDASLDPAECFRVRELNFAKEDLRVYLTEGHLIFSPPVNGVRFAAVFTAEKAEAGDAEILLLPPTPSERRSLARYLKTPNLNEHFRNALFLATDGSLDQLYRDIQAQEGIRRQEDVGRVLATHWNSVIRNLGQSFEIRFLQDLLTPQRADYGFLFLSVQSPRAGSFDVFYDPRAPEQFLVGRLEEQDSRQYYDVWTSFKSRAFRTGRRQPLPDEVKLPQYVIHATLSADLLLSCHASITIIPTPGSEHVLALDLARQMRIQEAAIDGKPALFRQHESLRANLLRGDGNDTFLVVPPEPLVPGKSYTLEIRYEGNVITSAGNNVFFVGSRGYWYPNRGLQFSHFDLTFRTPRSLSLAAAGDLVESREEGEFRLTRHRTSNPIRLLGFNLGDWERMEVKQGAFTIEVCANRRAERALEAKTQQYVLIPQSPPWMRNQRRPPEYLAIPAPPSRHAIRLQELAREIGEAYAWMAEHFGPPPWQRLIISPIPGNFGQGFPGLVYISTLSYLSELDPPLASRPPMERLFFQHHLPIHETAHQWWGNTLVPESHQDDWLMEALADYTALMYLEKRRGASLLVDILNNYRSRLLEKTPSGDTVESFGPIAWGGRLRTSLSPQSWQVITYQKGAWIMHMLRGIMGDERFRAFLSSLRREFEYKTLSTEQFRQLASRFLPKDYPDQNLESFFEQYVYDTGIPTLRLEHKITGRAPAWKLSARVVQTNVREDFSILVPIEVQLSAGAPIRRWLRTGNEDTTLELTLKASPVKVSLDPRSTLLFLRE